MRRTVLAGVFFFLGLICVNPNISYGENLNELNKWYNGWVNYRNNNVAHFQNRMQKEQNELYYNWYLPQHKSGKYNVKELDNMYRRQKKLISSKYQGAINKVENQFKRAQDHYKATVNNTAVNNRAVNESAPSGGGNNCSGCDCNASYINPRCSVCCDL